MSNLRVLTLKHETIAASFNIITMGSYARARVYRALFP
jgi:hypothetical protein